MQKINSKYSPIISCHEAESFILDYIDHQLPFYTWLKFKFHLFICPKCKRYLQAYMNTIHITKQITQDKSNTADNYSQEIPKELKDIILKLQRNK